MSGLRNLVDKLKPTFSEGGKLSFLASTFDAFETFLFVPNTTTQKGAHIRDCNDMKRTMIVVVVALLPALLFGMYNTGYQVGMTGWAAFWFGFLQVLPMIVVSYVVGLGIEFGFAQARGHEVNEGFLVTGLLILIFSGKNRRTRHSSGDVSDYGFFGFQIYSHSHGGIDETDSVGSSRLTAFCNFGNVGDIGGKFHDYRL